jgi:hypothetical protein
MSHYRLVLFDSGIPQRLDLFEQFCFDALDLARVVRPVSSVVGCFLWRFDRLAVLRRVADFQVLIADQSEHRRPRAL